MAVYDTFRSSGTGHFAEGRLSEILRHTVGRIIAWNDARRTRAALNALSDHELDDIGLVRGDITDLADGAFRN